MLVQNNMDEIPTHSLRAQDNKMHHSTKEYYIHSNKRPGHLKKLFWVGAYLFQYLLQRST